MLLEDFIIKSDDLVHDLGGIKKELLEIAAKMLILNDVCEQYIQFDANANETA